MLCYLALYLSGVQLILHTRPLRGLTLYMTHTNPPKKLGEELLWL